MNRFYWTLADLNIFFTVCEYKSLIKVSATVRPVGGTKSYDLFRWKGKKREKKSALYRKGCSH